MKQCEDCLFYDAQYDKMRRRGDDVVRVGQERKDRHFCQAYKNGIPENVFNDMEVCKRYCINYLKD